ncbi:MAG TPA: nickel-type superoxide dismutase maturation protease [Candidatus Limnocylindria bacterium]
MTTERGPRRALFLFLGSLAAVGAAAVAAGRWLDAVEVTGRSMAPTLLPGDRLLVEALTYRRRRPRAGEIVLAHDPRRPDRELVKRIGRVDPSSGGAELVGDAPDASTDSRTFGPVALEGLRWRAVARYWPPQRIARLGSSPET